MSNVLFWLLQQGLAFSWLWGFLQRACQSRSTINADHSARDLFFQVTATRIDSASVAAMYDPQWEWLQMEPGQSLVLFCSRYQTNQHPDHIETASGVSHFKSASHSKNCPLEFVPTAFEALNTASRSFPQGPRQKMSQGASRTSNFTGALIRVPPCSSTRVIPWQKSKSRIKSLPICSICFKS